MPDHSYPTAFRAAAARAAADLGDYRAGQIYEVPESTVRYWREKAGLPRRATTYRQFPRLKKAMRRGPATAAQIAARAGLPWRVVADTLRWQYVRGQVHRTGPRTRYVYSLPDLSNKKVPRGVRR